jgi:hypothetical protein
VDSKATAYFAVAASIGLLGTIPEREESDFYTQAGLSKGDFIAFGLNLLCETIRATPVSPPPLP